MFPSCWTVQAHPPRRKWSPSNLKRWAIPWCSSHQVIIGLSCQCCLLLSASCDMKNITIFNIPIVEGYRKANCVGLGPKMRPASSVHKPRAPEVLPLVCLGRSGSVGISWECWPRWSAWLWRHRWCLENLETGWNWTLKTATGLGNGKNLTASMVPPKHIRLLACSLVRPCRMQMPNQIPAPRLWVGKISPARLRPQSNKQHAAWLNHNHCHLLNMMISRRILATH